MLGRMNRIDAMFTELRGRGGKALMPFVTAGDPSLAGTEAVLARMADAGAHVCELGIPFSDPIADGPVIQASMTHALTQGLRVQQVFDMVRRLRARGDGACAKLGLVAMVSYSIVHRLGPTPFVAAAQDAGLDGFIFPDLPVEESKPIRDAVAKAGLILSMLIAPTTPMQRAQQIAQASSGFVYVLARAGITGERSEIPSDLPQRLTALRAVCPLPMAVGFGISSPQQVKQVVSVADAAIVGSAIMRRIADWRSDPPQTVAENTAALVRDLATGLR
jgi:tryptophan synthase alpha chain